MDEENFTITNNNTKLKNTKIKKKHNPKKIVSVVLIIILAITTCFGFTVATGTNLNGSTITGTVTNVSGKTITISVGSSGNLGGGSNTQGGQSAPPDMAQGSGNAQGSTPPEMPSQNSGTQTQQDGSAQSSASTENSSNTEAPQQPNEAPNSNGQQGGMGDNQSSSSTNSTIKIKILSSKIIKSSSADSKSASSSSITEGTTIKVTFGLFNIAKSVEIESASTTTSNSIDNGSSANTINSSSSASDSEYKSTSADENALRIENGGNANLQNITVTKSGNTTSEDNSNFYGSNAGILVTDSGNATISSSKITTNASGGNGIFAYGDGTVATVSNTTINTSKNNSGGIDCSGGATINANNLTVNTAGASSAAIRSDRGGGTVKVNKGTYKTSGTGSPAVYSTANISVSNATLNATKSEAIVVEGKNSVSLTNCNITGCMSGTYKDNSENIHNVMLYQSTSGDAEEGTSSFEMTGGSLTAKKGDMFYVTNTSCDINLTNVKMTYSKNSNLLSVEGNSSTRGWGKSGSNGGNCTFKASKQQLAGNISVDKISSLKLSLTSSSTFKGAINSSGQKGDVSVALSSDSTWTLTADSYVTSFSGNIKNVKTNGHTLYVNGVAKTA